MAGDEGARSTWRCCSRSARRRSRTSYTTTFTINRQAGTLIILSAKRPVTGRNALGEIEGEDYDGQSGATKEDSNDTDLGQSIVGQQRQLRLLRHRRLQRRRRRHRADARQRVERDQPRVPRRFADRHAARQVRGDAPPPSWATQTCTLCPTSGVHTLYVVVRRRVHLNWLQFQAGERRTEPEAAAAARAATPAAAAASSGSGGSAGSGGSSGSGGSAAREAAARQRRIVGERRLRQRAAVVRERRLRVSGSGGSGSGGIGHRQRAATSAIGSAAETPVRAAAGQARAATATAASGAAAPVRADRRRRLGGGPAALAASADAGGPSERCCSSGSSGGARPSRRRRTVGSVIAQAPRCSIDDVVAAGAVALALFAAACSKGRRTGTRRTDLRRRIRWPAASRASTSRRIPTNCGGCGIPCFAGQTLPGGRLSVRLRARSPATATCAAAGRRRATSCERGKPARRWSPRRPARTGRPDGQLDGGHERNRRRHRRRHRHGADLGGLRRRLQRDWAGATSRCSATPTGTRAHRPALRRRRRALRLRPHPDRGQRLRDRSLHRRRGGERHRRAAGQLLDRSRHAGASSRTSRRRRRSRANIRFWASPWTPPTWMKQGPFSPGNAVIALRRRHHEERRRDADRRSPST